LEEVVVGAIDERDPNGSALERFGSEEATETGADDDDVVSSVAVAAHIAAHIAAHDNRSTTSRA
jgi:hypothetical protein